MTLKELSAFTKGLTEEHPHLKHELVELYILACDEVEEGGSESHECSLAQSDMFELIKESQK
jgi:hypothetical protein